MHCYSDFWLNGGRLTPELWAEKDALLPPEQPLPFEGMSMKAWLALSPDEERARCEAWGEFTPPARRPCPPRKLATTAQQRRSPIGLVEIEAAIAAAGGGPGSVARAAAQLGVSRQLIWQRRREAAAD